MLISKTDILPYLLEFSTERLENCLHNLASSSPTLGWFSKNGNGVDDWNS